MLPSPLTRVRQPTISFLALCAHEYTITIFNEIRYVWRHKYTFATVLFAFNRYAVWVESGFFFHLAFGNLTTIDVSFCVGIDARYVMHDG